MIIEFLFFPFSSFEIADFPKKSENKTLNNQAYSYYRIHLNYLGKYKEKINTINQKIPESNFTSSILITDILPKFEMEKNHK